MTSEDVESVAWSPDGSKIAFDHSGDIAVMNADGSGLTNLTDDPGFEAYPAWSPDGSKIAFDHSGDIAVMNADGSNHRRLTDSPWGDGYPAWSPDGTRIVYLSGNNGWPCFRVMDADGGNSTCISTYDYHDYSPDWQLVQGEEWPKTFLPPDDSYVAQAKPNRTFGFMPWLRTKHAVKDMRGYLKFRISSLDNFDEATLRLYVTDPGPEVMIYAVSPYYRNTATPWQERELNWTNAPSIGGSPQGVIHPVKKGRWVELDVTAAVQGAIADGFDQVCFALTNSSRNLISFASKDEVRHAPELVVITN